jgi:sporulation protein YlmC with PRC-barrel domain
MNVAEPWMSQCLCAANAQAIANQRAEGYVMDQPANVVLSVSTVTGDTVRNMKGEDLGWIEEVMIDLDSGRIAYAVLSSGGFLGMGDRLYAIPWNALTVDLEQREFVLDMEKERLERAPGFDKENWPRMADRQWGETIHRYYGSKPYWYATTSAREPS